MEISEAKFKAMQQKLELQALLLRTYDNWEYAACRAHDLARTWLHYSQTENVICPDARAVIEEIENVLRTAKQLDRRNHNVYTEGNH